MQRAEIKITSMESLNDDVIEAASHEEIILQYPG